MITKFLHSIPAELAHDLAIAGLGSSAAGFFLPKQEFGGAGQEKGWGFAGIELAHPIGLAAGFDKNAKALPGLAHIGFSFVEIGTVTPKPQRGNARPRLFRLSKDKAIINRMGFNNDGMDVVLRRLEKKPDGLVVGANIGANKDSDDRLGDYKLGLQRFGGGLADYCVLNISSPNTPGLRDLQNPAELEKLLEVIEAARSEVPVMIKFAPDLADRAIEPLAMLINQSSVDGLILTNTTLARPAQLTDQQKIEQGGLSGPVLRSLSRHIMAQFMDYLDKKKALISVGGISSASEVDYRLRRGAAAVQLYTAFIYGGPALVHEIIAATLKPEN